jgi:hypothetical protein
MAPRFMFASFYFFIGGIQQFINSDPVKDALQADTSFERALAQTHYMKPLLCIGCIVGGGLLFFKRTTPLGVVIVTPIVIIIFFFHMLITRAYLWGTLNVVLLATIMWQFRRGFYALWNYKDVEG